MITDPGTGNLAILRWNATLIPELNTTSPVSYDRTISSTAPTDQNAQIMGNSTNFTFSRVSAQNDFPLVSRLLISPITNGLNVQCRDELTLESSAVGVNVTNGHPIPQGIYIAA